MNNNENLVAIEKLAREYVPMCPFCKQRSVIMESNASCWVAGIPSCAECSDAAQDGKDGSWMSDLAASAAGLQRVEVCRCTCLRGENAICANLTTWQYNGFAMCNEHLKANDVTMSTQHPLVTAWQIVACGTPCTLVQTVQTYEEAVAISLANNRNDQRAATWGIDPVYSLATVLAKIASCVDQALQDLWAEGLIETDAEEFEDWIKTVDELEVRLDNGVCEVHAEGWIVYLHTLAPDRVQSYHRTTSDHRCRPACDCSSCSQLIA
jgi:hypothetical protein